MDLSRTQKISFKLAKPSWRTSFIIWVSTSMIFEQSFQSPKECKIKEATQFRPWMYSSDPPLIWNTSIRSDLSCSWLSGRLFTRVLLTSIWIISRVSWQFPWKETNYDFISSQFLSRIFLITDFLFSKSKLSSNRILLRDQFWQFI